MRSWLCALVLAGAPLGWAAPARAGELCVLVTSPAGPPVGTCADFPFPTDCRGRSVGSDATGFVTIRVCYPAL
jgi:hypothetical protein